MSNFNPSTSVIDLEFIEVRCILARYDRGEEVSEDRMNWLEGALRCDISILNR